MKVLFVCLGNICRSPTAEGILKRLVLDAGLTIEVDSAGTSGWHDGELPDARSRREALRRGYDLSGQRSRKVVQADFDHFDLIIGMDYSNLANLRASAPKGARAELALLLDYLPGQSLREVPDPYYNDNFNAVFDLIEAACHGLLAQLKQRGLVGFIAIGRVDDQNGTETDQDNDDCARGGALNIFE